jgi:hypothetical protein
MLDLVNVTAIVRNDPEGAAAGTCRVEIVEPLNLAKHQPRGGYMLVNRQVQMTCAKSARDLSGRRDKIQGWLHSGRSNVNWFVTRPPEMVGRDDVILFPPRPLTGHSSNLG